MRAQRWPTAVCFGMAVALLVACSSSSPSTSTGGRAGQPAGEALPAELTPVLASVSTAITPVKTSDGRTFLAYELYLTNVASEPATIEAVRAVDAEGGTVVQEWTGADLLAHTRTVGAAPSNEPPTSVELQGGQVAIVWMAPSLPAGSAVPTALEHEIAVSYAEAPNPLIPAKLTEKVASAAVSSVPAPVIAPPLQGPKWLNGNGCCLEVTPHRGATNPLAGAYYLAERFGIDWVQLDAQGRLYDGDKTKLASYAYYGAPIHAVADGTVVAVVDDQPDEAPGANPPVGKLTVAQFGGNHVVERFERNGETYYAFYAHLKPGSASEAVKVGQKLKVGQVVGLLGNSGNSDSPHLHFHVMDGPDPLVSDGVPYVFTSMTVVGQADPNAINTLIEDNEPLAINAASSGARTDELPLFTDVVDFPAIEG